MLSITVFIFHMSKMRHREVRKLARGHGVGLELRYPAPYYFVFLGMGLSTIGTLYHYVVSW